MVQSQSFFVPVDHSTRRCPLMKVPPNCSFSQFTFALIVHSSSYTIFVLWFKVRNFQKFSMPQHSSNFVSIHVRHLVLYIFNIEFKTYLPITYLYTIYILMLFQHDFIITEFNIYQIHYTTNNFSALEFLTMKSNCSLFS